ncbi:calcium-binding protein [Microvirga sp. BT688]|uniref:M10 family metallopeptidase C-terminal domain-containing protein n=1 Tax=Microvirga sp. TaxID=1873136 RepID=UPI00168694F6|nr:calcium-binding protein [Microvirga sp.]MBD2747492.1 calcium-binding protein [Microvirga sp.]
MGLRVTGIENDFFVVRGPYAPSPIDWNSDAQVTVTGNTGVVGFSIGVQLADPNLDHIFIDPSSGITVTTGTNGQKTISIDGATGTIYGTNYAWGVTFKHDNPASGAAISKLIHALRYNSLGQLPAVYSKTIFMRINLGDGSEPREEAEIYTSFLNYDVGSSGNWGGTGGKDLSPEITGDLGPKTISDGGRPFSGVSITDSPTDRLTVVVRVNDQSKGSFLASSLSGGTYDPETGIYTVTGTPAQVQEAVRKLIFTQGAGLDGSRSSKAAVSFEISVGDGWSYTTKTMAADFRPNKADKLNGKASSEKLYGHGGKDTIDGKGGNDKIWGGSGNDKLTGGSGKDAFVFDTKANARTNKDAITDFSVRDDSIWLDNAFFSSLGTQGTESKPGQLKSSYFVTGSKAKDKNDFVIYDKAKGKLFYDADGSGSKIKAVEIATLSKDLAMTYKDFFVI